MHLIMILTALILAWLLRSIPLDSNGNWLERWQRSLFYFLFPPLIIITTVLATLLMGAQGKMMGVQASWVSYWLGLAFIISLVFHLSKLSYQAYITRQKILTYPETLLQNKKIRFLDISFPYIAQVGFCYPQLVVSQGLINLLDEAQLEAVLAHEQAHLRYRDTFYFFWLGWLKTCTSWLKNTNVLWEELLLLREIRADLEAAKTVDALILAESLLAVAQTPLQSSFCFEAGFSIPVGDTRLVQRIDALINDSTLPNTSNFIYWTWLLLLLIPWTTIPFHC